MYEELKLRYSSFDFASAIDEILAWEAELTEENQIKKNILRGVLDIILDNCVFE